MEMKRFECKINKSKGKQRRDITKVCVSICLCISSHALIRAFKQIWIDGVKFYAKSNVRSLARLHINVNHRLMHFCEDTSSRQIWTSFKQ